MVATRGPGFVGRTTERALLDGLLARVRAGESEALVIRGEAGIGKTALLRYAARQASGFRVAQITGVEAEMELAVRGGASVVRRDARPTRRDPRAAEGRPDDRSRDGSPAKRRSGSWSGLALLSLLSAVAEERPILCLVDDAQWLDAASAQVIGFVARRVRAESVAIVVAVREPARGARLRRIARAPRSKDCPTRCRHAAGERRHRPAR